jgi:hypothetical protein
VSNSRQSDSAGGSRHEPPGIDAGLASGPYGARIAGFAHGPVSPTDQVRRRITFVDPRPPAGGRDVHVSAPVGARLGRFRTQLTPDADGPVGIFVDGGQQADDSASTAQEPDPAPGDQRSW